MKGTIKDLLKISGVYGYSIARGNTLQVKLPSKHRFAESKQRIRQLYESLMAEPNKPGNVIEIYLEDIVLTIFLSGSTMLMVISNGLTNLALLRMTGKLVLASLVKEKHK